MENVTAKKMEYEKVGSTILHKTEKKTRKEIKRNPILNQGKNLIIEKA